MDGEKRDKMKGILLVLFSLWEKTVVHKGIRSRKPIVDGANEVTVGQSQSTHILGEGGDILVEFLETRAKSKTSLLVEENGKDGLGRTGILDDLRGREEKWGDKGR